VSSEYFFQTPNMAKYDLVMLCQLWSSKRGQRESHREIEFKNEEMAVVAALMWNIHHHDDGGLDTTTVGVGTSVALPENVPIEVGESIHSSKNINEHKPLANDLTWPMSNQNCLVGDTSASLQQQYFVQDGEAIHSEYDTILDAHQRTTRDGEE